MMQGDFPPSSSVIGVRFAAASAATLRPIAVDPVKNRWSNGRVANRAASAASPWMTLNSSSSNASCTRSAISSLVNGVSSLGLSITRLPAASAVAAGAKAS
ncbi:MAG: hypothetical protein BWX79_03366 [Alphaproteobacteria bacterium ADurb.Bin100]|nr:MAG: hypothetical protein BWX79_03366 [Alphaproteobacteria bacterium ADurb.Bin100]